MAEQSYAETFDTPEWRAQRDALMHQWIQNYNAVQWVLDFFNVCEFFDDAFDQDKPMDRDLILHILYTCMVDYPSNMFFRDNSHILIPQVSFVIMLWTGSNKLEARAQNAANIDKKGFENEGQHDLHKAFVLRNVYAMIIMTVIELTQGRLQAQNIMLEVMDFFGAESLREYMSGFSKVKREK